MLGAVEIRDTGSLTGNRDAMVARLNEIGALLAALEIGTLQQAPDGEWYACYWDEELQRTQCERSAPPTPLQQEVLNMTPGERARLQQELTAESADLVRQIDAITRQIYYGDSDPATTVVRVTSQQTPQGPIQVITQGPASVTPSAAAASSLWIPEDDLIAITDNGGGGPLPPVIVQEGPLPTDEGPPPRPVVDGDGVVVDVAPGDTTRQTAGVWGLIGLAALIWAATRGRGGRT